MTPMLSQISWLYAIELLLAEHGRMPDEGLLRAVTHQAIATIKKGIESFAIEIEKLDTEPS
jgi:hypothetical protein